MKILYCVTLQIRVICAAEQYFETTKRLILLRSKCCYPCFNCLEWPPSFEKLVQGVSVVCYWIILLKESCGSRAKLSCGPRKSFQICSDPGQWTWSDFPLQVWPSAVYCGVLGDGSHILGRQVSVSAMYCGVLGDSSYILGRQMSISDSKVKILKIRCIHMAWFLPYLLSSFETPTVYTVCSAIKV